MRACMGKRARTMLGRTGLSSSRPATWACVSSALHYTAWRGVPSWSVQWLNELQSSSPLRALRRSEHVPPSSATALSVQFGNSLARLRKMVLLHAPRLHVQSAARECAWPGWQSRAERGAAPPSWERRSPRRRKQRHCWSEGSSSVARSRFSRLGAELTAKGPKCPSPHVERVRPAQGQIPTSPAAVALWIPATGPHPVPCESASPYQTLASGHVPTPNLCYGVRMVQRRRRPWASPLLGSLESGG